MRRIHLLTAAMLLAAPAAGHATAAGDTMLCSGKTPTTAAKAIAACDRLIGQHAGDKRRLADLYVYRSRHHREIGQLERAAADLSEALRHDPRHAVAYFNRGAIYRTLKRYDDAIRDFSKYLELAPQNATLARIERGYTYLKAKRYRRAVHDLSAALQPDLQLPYVLLLRARAHIGLGRKPAAVADLRKALKLADAAITVPAAKIRKDARKLLRQIGVTP